MLMAVPCRCLLALANRPPSSLFLVTGIIGDDFIKGIRQEECAGRLVLVGLVVMGVPFAFSRGMAVSIPIPSPIPSPSPISMSMARLVVAFGRVVVRERIVLRGGLGEGCVGGPSAVHEASGSA